MLHTYAHFIYKHIKYAKIACSKIVNNIFPVVSSMTVEPIQKTYFESYNCLVLQLQLWLHNH